MQRDITKVIDEVLALIPDSEPAKRSLILELGEIKRQAIYTAPECMSALWREASRILDQYTTPEPEDYHQKMMLIWNGKDVESNKRCQIVTIQDLVPEPDKIVSHSDNGEYDPPSAKELLDEE
jgi:hypothetical protein